MSLQLVPITFKQAKHYVDKYHRHLSAPLGLKFSIGLEQNGKLVGVVIVGRPVARHLDDGHTAEVTRCCTIGIKHACSKLYAAAWRASKAMGYRKLITYTLASESGTCLRAVGWRKATTTRGGSWSRPTRLRFDNHPLESKVRWEIEVAENV